MKRYFIIFCLCFTCFAHCQSAINRSPYGIPLGENMGNIKKILNEKGLDYNVYDSRLGITLIVKNVYFSDLSWDMMGISFLTDKAYMIQFIKETKYESEYQIMLANLSLLVDVGDILSKLAERYKEYSVESENENNESNEDIKYINSNFADGKTCILFKAEMCSTKPSTVYLVYSDEAMTKQKLYVPSNEF